MRTFNTLTCALLSCGAFRLMTQAGGTASSARLVLFIIGALFAAVAVLNAIAPRDYR